jgi:aromatic ring-opening dioxygenase catalytic subunit (LigB family)
VFLTDGTNQFSLREGDHFANGWKVRRLTESLLVLQNGKIQHKLKLVNESLGN